MLEKLRLRFAQPDPDEIVAFQYKLPRSITVSVDKRDGMYLAKVDKINDEELDTTTFLTEAKTLIDLVTEINDMLLTYLDFPENIKPRMPKFLPPAEFFEHEGLVAKGALHKELVFAK